MSQQTISSPRYIPHEFNPLLRNEPKTQEALTACAILLISGKLKNAIGWREISEWIGGYEYILPAERTILDELAILLIQSKGYTEFNKLHYFLLTNCSVKTQQDLIDYMKGNLNGYPTKTTLI